MLWASRLFVLFLSSWSLASVSSENLVITRWKSWMQSCAKCQWLPRGGKAALLFLLQCYVIRWKPDERGEEQVTNQVSMIAKGSRNRRPALLFLLQYYVMIKILWKSDEKGKWKRWLIKSGANDCQKQQEKQLTYSCRNMMFWYFSQKKSWKSDEKGKWERWLIRCQWLPKGETGDQRALLFLSQLGSDRAWACALQCALYTVHCALCNV